MSKSLKDIADIRKAERQTLAKEAQAYHDLTVQGDPDRAFFAYIYSDKKPNVKFLLALSDIIRRLGSAWSPALRNVFFAMTRQGKLLISTFHKPPGAHILETEDEDMTTPFESTDSSGLEAYARRQRAEQQAADMERETEDADTDGDTGGSDEFEEDK